VRAQAGLTCDHDDHRRAPGGAFPNIGDLDAACAAIEGLWRTSEPEPGPYGIRLVMAAVGSADIPGVQEPLRRHASTAGNSRQEILADSGRGVLAVSRGHVRESLPAFLPAIERLFAPIIFSYQHGACKPSPALYEAVVQHTGVVAQATLLIDDAQGNVRGAQSAGWQAIHFTTPGALRKALRDLGVEGCGSGGSAEEWQSTHPVNLR